MTYPQQPPDGSAHVSQDGRGAANPVVHHLSVLKTRARMLDAGQVERKAQQLLAANSFDDWDDLSDSDRELWLHMARLDLC